MSIDFMYNEIMGIISPILVLSGWLAFTITMIIMLINMVIGAATGKGFNIGLK